jgi:hypothetical protein
VKPRHPTLAAPPRPPALPPGYKPAKGVTPAEGVAAFVPDMPPVLFTLPGPDFSINARPHQTIRFAGKPTRAMEQRRKRDEYARRLERERRFAEAAAVRVDDDPETPA